ncbi:MAG: hypothetical protein WC907_08220, partial [Acholeplasmataceae bacterium]
MTIELDGDGKVSSIANSSTMPRAMAANYIMSSDEDGDGIFDYALGRDLKIIDGHLSRASVRKSFDDENPFPIITLPGNKTVDANGIWKTRYIQTVYLDEYEAGDIYNPLLGIKANDGKGNDVTANITYKIYPYKTTMQIYGDDFSTSLPINDPKWAEFFDEEVVWNFTDHEIAVERVLASANADYIIEYSVTANGHTDKAYRLIQVRVGAPDYIELYDESDTVYSLVMGIEQRLEMNPDLDEFGAMNATEKGILYNYAQYQLLSNFPTLNKGVVVVLDDKYQVKVIRVLANTGFEIDASGKVTLNDLAWVDDGILEGLDDLVTAGGYVLIYPEGKDGVVLSKALRAYVDYDYDEGDITAEVKNKAVNVSLTLKEVQEVKTLLLNGEPAMNTISGADVAIKVLENSKESLVFYSAGGGARFRLGTGIAYYYTKEMYTTLSQTTEVVNSFTTASPNHGVPWFRDGSIVVLDEDGNFVFAWIMTTAAAAVVEADGTVVYGNAASVATTEAALAAAGENNLPFDIVIPDKANTEAHGPFATLLDYIPEGGSFIILPGGTSSAVRNFGIEVLWNSEYPGSGVIVDATVDEPPANVDTNGFDFDNYDEDYFAALKFEVDLVATIIDKPAKLTRPTIELDGNSLNWQPVDGAASYDLYIGGVLKQRNIGVLNEEDNVYTVDLTIFGLADGTHKVQLRAITADNTVKSTSVLSKVLEYTLERLGSPDLETFVLEDNIVKWSVVPGASKYLVSISKGEYFEVETNEVEIPDNDLVTGTEVSVIATGSTELLDSLPTTYVLDIPVIPREIIMGESKLPIVEFTLNAWLRLIDPALGNDVGGTSVEGIIVINDAYGIKELADDKVLFSGGYVAVVDEDLKVKYIVDRWAHEWNADDGWTTNAGGWDWALNLKASYFKPYLAEGDKLIMAAQTGKGLAAGTYRNYFGDALIKDLGGT